MSTGQLSEFSGNLLRTTCDDEGIWHYTSLYDSLEYVKTLPSHRYKLPMNYLYIFKINELMTYYSGVFFNKLNGILFTEQRQSSTLNKSEI